MSNRRCRWPSVRDAYSRPWASVAIRSQGASSALSTTSSAGPEPGSTETDKVAGSKSARQMIRASVAGSSGFSAKVQPPVGRRGRTTGNLARPGMPCDIVSVSPQPFPHQPGPVDAAKCDIGSSIPPVFRHHGARLSHHCSPLSRWRPARTDYIPLGCPAPPSALCPIWKSRDMTEACNLPAGGVRTPRRATAKRKGR